MTLLICVDAVLTCTRNMFSLWVCCLQNIHVTAYSPLGTPPSSTMFKDYQPPLVMNDPVVKEIAKKYNKNVGQVQLAAEASCVLVKQHLLCVVSLLATAFGLRCLPCCWHSNA